MRTLPSASASGKRSGADRPDHLTCVDLDRAFGDSFKIINEPGSGLPPKPKARDPWLREIKCRHGRIWPMGPTTLAAWTGPWADLSHEERRRTLVWRLLKIPGITRHQVGDLEATVIFEVDFPAQKEVFRLLKPHQVRRVHSPRLLDALKRGRERLNEKRSGRVRIEDPPPANGEVLPEQGPTTWRAGL